MNTLKQKINIKKQIIFLKQHLTKIYCSNIFKWKILIFIVCGFVVLLSSFLVREWALNSQTRSQSFLPGFIDIFIIGNTGISFSLLENSPSELIYFIQSIPIFVCLIVLIFSYSKIIDVFISIIFFAGLSNVVDRGLIDNYKYLYNIEEINAVVDYFKFSFIRNSAIFNLPDTFIVLSTIGLILFIITNSFMTVKKEREKKDNANKKEN